MTNPTLPPSTAGNNQDNDKNYTLAILAEHNRIAANREAHLAAELAKYKKAEQARINGSKSRGPVTAEGQLRSARSGIRHGRCGNENTLLETESPEEYNEVRQAFIADLRPATKAELRLVEKIANLDWRLERLVMMETALFNLAADTNFEEIQTRIPNIDGIGIIVESWLKAKSTAECFELLRRYQTSHQNQFNATLKNFRNLELARLARKRANWEEEDKPHQAPEFDTMPSNAEPRPTVDDFADDPPVATESEAPQTNSGAGLRPAVGLWPTQASPTDEPTKSIKYIPSRYRPAA